jgi:hypothetical protein
MVTATPCSRLSDSTKSKSMPAPWQRHVAWDENLTQPQRHCMGPHSIAHEFSEVIHRCSSGINSHQNSHLTKWPPARGGLLIVPESFPNYSIYSTYMAEREGFEPPIALRLCLISSQVHSTGLCHLSALFSKIYRRLLAVQHPPDGFSGRTAWAGTGSPHRCRPLQVYWQMCSHCNAIDDP